MKYALTIDEARLLIGILEYADDVGDDALGDAERALLERLREFVADDGGMAEERRRHP